MNTAITINEFRKALVALDNELNSLSSSSSISKELLPLDIKAIGGFALLYHNVRESGYTADIDSVTNDYHPEIIKCIKSVARKLDFQEDWVNNYNVFENDVDAVELLIEPLWLRSDWKFKNIRLWIADKETLVKSKLIASEDDLTSKRAQDFPDLVDLFRSLMLTDLISIITYCDRIDINLSKEYPRNLGRLRKIFSK